MHLTLHDLTTTLVQAELNFARYVATAGAVAGTLSTVLRKTAAKFRIQPRLATYRQIAKEIARSVRTCIVFALLAAIVSHLGGPLGQLASDAFRRHGSIFSISLSFVALVLLHDTYFYWTHRAMHSRYLFKLIHLTHHRSRTPTPWTAYSFSSGEAIVQAAFPITYALVFPTPIIALMAWFFFDLIINALGHSGIEFFPSALVLGRYKIVAGTTHHDIHHQQFAYNYGLYFRFWDIVMKTEHPEFEEIYIRVRRLNAEPQAT